MIRVTALTCKTFVISIGQYTLKCVGFCPTRVGLCPHGLLCYGLLSGYRVEAFVVDFL